MRAVFLHAKSICQLATKSLLAALALASAAISPAQDFSRVPAAQQPEAARLFKIYRSSADQAAREQAVNDLLKLDAQAMLALTPVLEYDWHAAVTAFQATEQRLAAETARKRLADPVFVKEVHTLRATLERLRSGKSLPTKDQLHDEADPAMRRLRELHKIAPQDLTAALPALGPLRESALALTRMRSALKLRTILKNPADFSEDDLKRAEAATLTQAFQTNQAATRVLDANAALAAKQLVPADEAEGVRGLNEMRMLAGLMPCLIDPKLHDAARGHSQDMATLNFFAHESPVPKKKTPQDRAKLAGTTADAENIHQGSEKPEDANNGWFLSPGHHVNMFGNHRRVGMGRHETYWTQMFGS